LKYPDLPADGFAIELEGAIGMTEEEEEEWGVEQDPIALLFSGEEAFGKYLDLYANQTQYNNLKHIDKHLSYLHYLDVLSSAKDGGLHSELPKVAKMTKEYETYLASLHAYLLSFSKRTQPLVNVDEQQQEASDEFEKRWEEGQITGWEDEAMKQNGAGEGVWCGACQKMYAKQTVFDAHLKSKKHLKAVARSDPSTSAAAPTTENGGTPAPAAPARKSKYYNTARLTSLILSLLVPLNPIIVETRSNVERRFSLTSRERELELEEPVNMPAPAANGAAEEEEEEERIYNPLKLPLGWDGKPIPYWLYKLHGLGVEYRCEICSDAVYMGRKNFDRHFQESRHAFGMRALGLPNTKHFHEITRIEDALALAEKLKQEGRQEIFQNETMEELEDDEGNVYNKKTYDDLKKQGLI